MTLWPHSPFQANIYNTLHLKTIIESVLCCKALDWNILLVSWSLTLRNNAYNIQNKILTPVKLQTNRVGLGLFCSWMSCWVRVDRLFERGLSGPAQDIWLPGYQKKAGSILPITGGVFQLGYDWHWMSGLGNCASSYCCNPLPFPSLANLQQHLATSSFSAAFLTAQQQRSCKATADGRKWLPLPKCCLGQMDPERPMVGLLLLKTIIYSTKRSNICSKKVSTASVRGKWVVDIFSAGMPVSNIMYE